jgi:hypothetical protein
VATDASGESVRSPKRSTRQPMVAIAAINSTRTVALTVCRRVIVGAEPDQSFTNGRSGSSAHLHQCTTRAGPIPMHYNSKLGNGSWRDALSQLPTPQAHGLAHIKDSIAHRLGRELSHDSLRKARLEAVEGCSDW